jgi:hypothetical protein
MQFSTVIVKIVSIRQPVSVIFVEKPILTKCKPVVVRETRAGLRNLGARAKKNLGPLFKKKIVVDFEN